MPRKIPPPGNIHLPYFRVQFQFTDGQEASVNTVPSLFNIPNRMSQTDKL